MGQSTRVDRERVFRTLTFWLRPAFVLRALSCFQRVAGFDRAIALASGALTALIPLAILAGAVLPHVQATDAANWIIDRYRLSGGGAEAVDHVLSPATGANTDITVFGAILLVIAVLSFSRGVQRLFEQTWELAPLSVRNTVNDLIWIIGLVVYLVITAGVHRLIDVGRLQIATNLVVMPVTAIFLAWSGRILSAKRIGWPDLLPFAALGAVTLAIYFTVAAVYMPHLFSSYATRYGAIGAVLAMISALFGIMLVVVGSAAVGREVFVELGRIRRGERPADDEVRREWETVIAQARSRWEAVRERVDRRRRDDKPSSMQEGERGP